MAERLVLVLLSVTVGVLIGLFAPSFFQPAQDIQQAQQTFLNPPPPSTPTPSTQLAISRPATAQPVVPPTLQPPPAPTPAPTRTPEPTPPVRTFVVALKGGGEMRVLASDEAAAINNVKAEGATPANQP